MHGTALPDTQLRLLAALRQPACYPHAVRQVRLVETHISWVLLAGSHAYKIKKAVNLGFLDFSSLAARQRYCREELRLNRRLAPQLYLEVIPIGGTPDAPLLGAEPAFEYAVKMRRFASTNQFDRLLTHGKLQPVQLDQLARCIAKFHAGLAPAQPESGYGTAQANCAAALQNFQQMQALFPEEDQRQLSQLSAATSLQCKRLADLMTTRLQQGHVRECHGDLHLGNIVLLRGEPVPFDAIEFNAELRWIDVINEIAFTVMDLLQYQRPDLAWRVLNGWLEESGDYAGLALLPFYLSYRAAVRAKVSAIRQAQPGLSAPARQAALADSRRYLQLAQRVLQPGWPLLILTHGLPGSGKSTFSQQALERLGAVRIRSDVERKRLHGLDPLADSRSAAGSGLYGAEATVRTYAHLLALAGMLLQQGYRVIVDAAFLRERERSDFHRLAQRLGAPSVTVTMQCSETELHRRIVQRQQAGTDASEADLQVLQLLQQKQEPLTAAERALALVFDQHEPAAQQYVWSRLLQLTGAGISSGAE